MASEISVKLKLADMKKYIPFLESIITKLENEKPREEQLKKIRMVYELLTKKNNKLSLSTLLKCEQVLLKLSSKMNVRCDKHRDPFTSRFESANEIEPIDSPDSLRDFDYHSPIIIPTERTTSPEESSHSRRDYKNLSHDEYSTKIDTQKRYNSDQRTWKNHHSLKRSRPNEDLLSNDWHCKKISTYCGELDESMANFRYTNTCLPLKKHDQSLTWNNDKYRNKSSTRNTYSDGSFDNRRMRNETFSILANNDERHRHSPLHNTKYKWHSSNYIPNNEFQELSSLQVENGNKPTAKLFQECVPPLTIKLTKQEVSPTQSKIINACTSQSKIKQHNDCNIFDRLGPKLHENVSTMNYESLQIQVKNSIKPQPKSNIKSLKVSETVLYNPDYDNELNNSAINHASKTDHISSTISNIKLNNDRNMSNKNRYAPVKHIATAHPTDPRLKRKNLITKSLNSSSINNGCYIQDNNNPPSIINSNDPRYYLKQYGSEQKNQIHEESNEKLVSNLFDGHVNKNKVHDQISTIEVNPRINDNVERDKYYKSKKNKSPQPLNYGHYRQLKLQKEQLGQMNIHFFNTDKHSSLSTTNDNKFTSCNKDIKGKLNMEHLKKSEIITKSNDVTREIKKEMFNNMQFKANENNDTKINLIKEDKNNSKLMITDGPLLPKPSFISKRRFTTNISKDKHESQKNTVSFIERRRKSLTDEVVPMTNVVICPTYQEKHHTQTKAFSLIAKRRRSMADEVFSVTNDSSSLSTQNIITGKRRTRANVGLQDNLECFQIENNGNLKQIENNSNVKQIMKNDYFNKRKPEPLSTELFNLLAENVSPKEKLNLLNILKSCSVESTTNLNNKTVQSNNITSNDKFKLPKRSHLQKSIKMVCKTRILRKVSHLKTIKLTKHKYCMFTAKNQFNRHRNGRKSVKRSCDKKRIATNSLLPTYVLSHLKENMYNNALYYTSRQSELFYEYRCPFCDIQNLYSSQKWIEHFRSHTGEFKFKCSKCFKAFNNASHMYYHIKRICKNAKSIREPSIHIKNDSISGFVCTICNFTQMRKKNVIMHIKNVHPNEKYANVMCVALLNINGIPKIDQFVEMNSRSIYTSITNDNSNKNELIKKQPETASNTHNDICTISSSKEHISGKSVKSEDDENWEDVNDNIYKKNKKNCSAFLYTLNRFYDSILYTPTSKTLRNIINLESNLTNNNCIDSCQKEKTIENNLKGIKRIDNIGFSTVSGHVQYHCFAQDCKYTLPFSSIVQLLRHFKDEHSQICWDGYCLTCQHIVYNYKQTVFAEENHYFDVHTNNQKKRFMYNNDLPINNRKEITNQDVICNVAHKNNRHVFSKYICMNTSCTFHTDSSRDYMQHLKCHLISTTCSKNILNCIYCNYRGKSVTDFFLHLYETHGRDIYRCPYCLYRSCEDYSAYLHVKFYHPKKEIYVYVADEQSKKLLADVNHIKLRKFGQKKLKELPCVVCSKGFYSIKSYIAHIQNHTICGNAEEYICTFCSANIKIQNVENHLRDNHNVGFYECLYCSSTGSCSDNKHLVARHISINHPSELLGLYVRTFDLKKDIYTNNYFQMEYIKKPVDVVIQFIYSSGVQRKGNLDALLPLSNDAEKKLFNKTNPLLKELNKALEGLVKDTGIRTQELYKCVIPRCPAQLNKSTFIHHLKEHESHELSMKSFSCYYCGNCYSNAMELKTHIQIHGKHSYVCYICGTYTSASLSTMNHHYSDKHMYTKPTKTYSLSGSSHNEFYVVCPNNIEYSRLDEFADKLIKNFTKRMLLPKQKCEKHLQSKIPENAIFKDEVFCTECQYKTKIRTNMIRHLKMHADQKLVPNIDPVNPVPCLNSSQKHFDNMANLACSSNAISKKSRPIPKFVPLMKRFRCGYCSYLTKEDSPNFIRHLKRSHGNASHSYVCPHCNKVICKKCICVKKIMQHLKLHDSILYQCDLCSFFHSKQSVVTQHISEKHAKMKVNLIKLFRDSNGSYMTPIEYKGANNSTDRFCDDEKEINTEYADIKWVCCTCNLQTSTYKDMIVHATKEHNYKFRYQCLYCSFGDKHTPSIMDHITKHHSTETKIYQTTFKKIVIKNEEINYNKPLWLRDDPKRVKHIRGILMQEFEHQSREESDNESEENNSGQNNIDLNFLSSLIFYCFHCPENFNCYNNLQRHWETEHCLVVNGVIISQLPFLFKISKTMICVYCMDFSGSMLQIKSHINTAHESEKFAVCDFDNSGMCAFCNYEHHNIDNLCQHIADKHKHCEIKNFNQYNLTNVRSLGDSQIFLQCYYCAHIFSSEKLIMEHEKAAHLDHTSFCFRFKQIKNEILYLCHLCQYASTNEIAVLRHMLDHYKGFKSCESCDINFDGFNSFAKHLKYEHPTQNKIILENTSKSDLFDFFLQMIVIFPNGFAAEKYSLQLTLYGSKDKFENIFMELLRKAEPTSNYEEKINSETKRKISHKKGNTIKISAHINKNVLDKSTVDITENGNLKCSSLYKSYDQCNEPHSSNMRRRKHVNYTEDPMPILKLTKRRQSLKITMKKGLKNNELPNEIHDNKPIENVLHNPKEYSFYGAKSALIDLSKIQANIPINEKIVSIRADHVNRFINLDCRLRLHKIDMTNRSRNSVFKKRDKTCPLSKKYIS